MKHITDLQAKLKEYNKGRFRLVENATYNDIRRDADVLVNARDIERDASAHI
jgi:hypothetical protein